MQKIIPYRPHLKTLARELRKNMTRGEVTLWQYLKAKKVLGYNFDRQRPIDEFIVDFYCKDLMLAIEIDGASHDNNNAQIKDEVRQKQLESFGVQFLRFTESDACNHPEVIVEAIKQWIGSLAITYLMLHELRYFWKSLSPFGHLPQGRIITPFI